MIAFQRTVSENADFQNLVTLLDEDLKIRDGSEHAFYAQFNKTTNIQSVIVCFVDNKPVGCGAFKEYAKGGSRNKKDVCISRISRPWDCLSHIKGIRIMGMPGKLFNVHFRNGQKSTGSDKFIQESRICCYR